MREERILLTDAGVPVDNLKDLITALLVGHARQADAAKDGGLAQVLPGRVALVPEGEAKKKSSSKVCHCSEKKMDKEVKAKVVAAAWGAKCIQVLVPLARMI